MGRVFIDKIGFRQAGFRLTRPATVTNAAGRALTVTELVSTPERRDLIAGTGGGIYAPAPEPLATLTIPCAAPADARMLTLRSAYIHLRGPWRIAIPALT